MRERLSLHLTTHEVVILSGGVSMGKFDLVPKVLGPAGRATRCFTTSRSVPASPCGSASVRRVNRCSVLPGNPVSTLVCLIRYVIPAIAEAMGTRRVVPERLALASPGDLPAAARLLPAGRHRARRLGPTVGQSAAAEWLGRFLEPRRHRRVRRTSARPQHLREGLRHQHVSLVTSTAMQTSNVHDIRGANNPLDRRGRGLARSAHLGHGPLQLPLPLLHAEGAVSRALPVPEIPGAALVR